MISVFRSGGTPADFVEKGGEAARAGLLRSDVCRRL
ncbi:hypothetical protein CASFOL_010406 [Castilleja foliolosa]|uniref:Uncharacterized protein n=1 Tax=Castilleja foliolosa TaxID=1961234 RepID=A0ABD3DU00_9LAMI